MIDKAVPQGVDGQLDQAQVDWLRLMPDGWNGRPFVQCWDCKWLLIDEFGHWCRWFCRKLDSSEGFCTWGERKGDA